MNSQHDDVTTSMVNRPALSHYHHASESGSESSRSSQAHPQDNRAEPPGHDDNTRTQSIEDRMATVTQKLADGVMINEHACPLQQRAHSGPLCPEYFGSGFLWPWKGSDARSPRTLQLLVPVNYTSYDPERGENVNGQLTQQLTDDLLVTLLESLHPDECPSKLFDTSQDNEYAPFPEEVRRYMVDTAARWYASHADPHPTCNPEYLASRRRRLLDGFVLTGVLSHFRIRINTGSSGFYYNEFLALNSDMEAFNPQHESGSSPLLTAVTNDHPCNVTLRPSCLHIGTRNDDTGVVRLNFSISLELCSGTSRTLPRGDARLEEYREALNQRFNQDGDTRLINACRCVQREDSYLGLNGIEIDAENAARKYLHSIASEAASGVFERQRQSFVCSNMLDFSQMNEATPLRSRWVPSGPMKDAEVMDEALICLDDRTRNCKYGAQTPAVISTTLTMLEALGTSPAREFGNARWSTILRVTVETIDGGFSDLYRRPWDYSYPLGIPMNEADPRCVASAKIVPTSEVPKEFRTVSRWNKRDIDHHIQVQAYLRPKASSDDQFFFKGGLQGYLPIRRVWRYEDMDQRATPDIEMIREENVTQSISRAGDRSGPEEGQRAELTHPVTGPSREELNQRFEELRAWVQ